MKKALLLLLVLPSAASAQVPVYPNAGAGAPNPNLPQPSTNLDPGTSGSQAKPEPPPPTPKAPQSPVVVVRPDGTVTTAAPQEAEPTGYYVGEGAAPVEQQPAEVHGGPVPELHVVRRGDTLWDICWYYFNDPWQWPKVWSYNPQITNPHWIYPGDLVRLLPRGMFAEQPEGKQAQVEQPESAKPVDNLPPPAQKLEVGIRQAAFVEKADLDKSITIDGSVDEKVLLGINDSVYLSYPAGKPPQVGQRYSIYQPGNPVKAGGKDVGAYVRVLGTVEVVSVKQDKRARGVITEVNQEIERGAKVGPLVKEFKNVPPVPPKVEAQGTIVAMLTKDQLIGQGEIIFVDLGQSSGVEVGNRMFVVRRGDAYPGMATLNIGQDDRRFPARALGEVVIVEVGQKISVGLITLAVQEMGVGDIVMMQKSN